MIAVWRRAGVLEDKHYNIIQPNTSGRQPTFASGKIGLCTTRYFRLKPFYHFGTYC